MQSQQKIKDISLFPVSDTFDLKVNNSAFLKLVNPLLEQLEEKKLNVQDFFHHLTLSETFVDILYKETIPSLRISILCKGFEIVNEPERIEAFFQELDWYSKKNHNNRTNIDLIEEMITTSHFHVLLKQYQQKAGKAEEMAVVSKVLSYLLNPALQSDFFSNIAFCAIDKDHMDTYLLFFHNLFTTTSTSFLSGYLRKHVNLKESLIKLLCNFQPELFSDLIHDFPKVLNKIVVEYYYNEHSMETSQAIYDQLLLTVRSNRTNHISLLELLYKEQSINKAINFEAFLTKISLDKLQEWHKESKGDPLFNKTIGDHLTQRAKVTSIIRFKS